MQSDGPATALFQPLRLKAPHKLPAIHEPDISREMQDAFPFAPRGECVCHGIPFHVERVAALTGKPREIGIPPTVARWLIFLHCSDLRPLQANAHGFFSPTHGEGILGELAYTCTVRYADGMEASVPMFRRRQIGCFTRRWGENCFEAVAHRKPHPLRASHEQLRQGWGNTQTRVDAADFPRFCAWLYAWENLRPAEKIVSLLCTPAEGASVLLGVSAGSTSSNPLRWERRRKALVTLEDAARFSLQLDNEGLLQDIKLEIGRAHV
jgi:hypothetical protein